MALPNTLKGFTLVADGVGTIGKLNSGQLPKLSTHTEEFRDGGMDAPVDLDMGMDKMVSTYGFAEYEAQLMGLWGLTTGTKSFTLYGSLEDEEGTAIPIVGSTRGLVTVSDPGDWTKGGANSELKLTHSLRFFQLLIDSREVYYIDVANVIRRVNGVDQLAARRSNLGL